MLLNFRRDFVSMWAIEEIMKVLGDCNACTFFLIDHTLGTHWMKVKGPVHSHERNNCIYKIVSKECSAEYIGQTSRQLELRIVEHKRNENKSSQRNSFGKPRMKLYGRSLCIGGGTQNWPWQHKNSSSRLSDTERLYAESLTVSANRSCASGNERSAISAIWTTLTSRLIKYPSNRTSSLTSVDPTTSTQKCYQIRLTPILSNRTTQTLNL